MVLPLTNHAAWPPSRADDESVSKATYAKQIREISNQLQEIQEDLETEKEARNKAEKQKRDLNEVRLWAAGFSCVEFFLSLLSYNLFNDSGFV